MTYTATLDIQRPSPHVARVWLNRPDVRMEFEKVDAEEVLHDAAQAGAKVQAIIRGVLAL